MSILNLNTGVLRKSTLAALVVGLPLAGCGSAATTGAARRRGYGRGDRQVRLAPQSAA